MRQNHGPPNAAIVRIINRPLLWPKRDPHHARQTGGIQPPFDPMPGACVVSNPNNLTWRPWGCGSQQGLVLILAQSSSQAHLEMSGDAAPGHHCHVGEYTPRVTGNLDFCTKSEFCKVFFFLFFWHHGSPHGTKLWADLCHGTCSKSLRCRWEMTGK